MKAHRAPSRRKNPEGGCPQTPTGIASPVTFAEAVMLGAGVVEEVESNIKLLH